MMGANTGRADRSHHFGAVMFMVAGVIFLLVGLLGRAGANTVFIVLGMAFVSLALAAFRGRAHSERWENGSGSV